MKVLVAEDDAHIRRGLREVLEAEGYVVIEAVDGGQARERFAAETPDIALLDIMMPVANGYDLCREFRRERPDMPVIFVSAKSEEIDRVLGLELGADDFISKPFGVREVIARIRAVTRRAYARMKPEPSDEASIDLGPMTLYPRELRARRGDEDLELSLRDVNILKLLHRERGKVVTREMLFNEVWGMSFLPNSRTIDQHISKLRKRIETDPKEPDIIKTVHGVGYRMD
ncbi:MAG: response regulator transcription factor [Myxococcales bacterium]|nr:response regulator transcription factor [Myxococcales bacterium]MCB9732655.1 response regulator transcription factor [Deltaproteobacteria bacterium]